MMTVVTWVAVVVLAIGSLGVFVLFLRDIPKVVPRRRDEGMNEDDSPHTGS